MRSIALLLASSDIDGQCSEETMEEAMEMIEDESPRVDLSGSLGLEAVNCCTSDEAYERTLSLLLSALLRESESIAEYDSEEPNDTSLGLSKASCYLILKYSESSRSGTDLMEKAADVLASSLSSPEEEEEEVGDDFEHKEYQRIVTSVMVRSLINVARSPVGAAGDFTPPVGLYAPALVLAVAARSANPPPSNNSSSGSSFKWNSQSDDSKSAFRRDVLDLLGRRIFGMGGGAGVRPATPGEVELTKPLLCTMTKDEFEGAMPRPMRFRLMSSPSTTMRTVAALVNVLSGAGKGSFVVPHLRGGTNIVGVMVKQLEEPTGSAGAVDVARALIIASPEDCLHPVAKDLVERLGVARNKDSAIALCGALREVAQVLWHRLKKGDNGEPYRQVANQIVLPALQEFSEKAAEVGASALSSWKGLAARGDNTSPRAYSSTSPYHSKTSASLNSSEHTQTVGARSVSATTSSEAAALDQRIASKFNDVGRLASDADADADAGAGALTGPAAGAVVGAVSADARTDAARIEKTNAGERTRNSIVRARRRNSAKMASVHPVQQHPLSLSSSRHSDERSAEIAAKSRSQKGTDRDSITSSSLSPVQNLDDRIARKRTSVDTNSYNNHGHNDTNEGTHKDNYNEDQDKIDPAPEGTPPTFPYDDQDNTLGGPMGPTQFSDVPHHQEYHSTPIPVPSHGMAAEPDVERGANPPDPYARASQGIANTGGTHYGGEDQPLMVGGHGENGDPQEPRLVVASLVPPDEVHEFSDDILPAVEYDPDAKPPLYKNRRFRVYAIAASIVFVLILAVIVVAVLVSQKNKDKPQRPNSNLDPPTFPPTSPSITERDEDGIYELIAANLDLQVSEVWNKSSNDPIPRAANWIVNEDPMQLTRKQEVDLMNRFVLVHFYYVTKGPTHWLSCYENKTDPYNYNCSHFVEFTMKEDTYFGANWLSPVHHCNWFGVGCGTSCKWNQLCDDLEPTQVNLRTLRMWKNNLNGTLPTELAQIDTLQHISILENAITGTLPSDILSMRSLTDLELSGNLLSGTLPDELFDESQMFRLNLARNIFTGTLSTRIGDLSNMQSMYLFDNPFITGTIPTEVGNLQNLVHLYMGGMEKINGTLPSEIGNIQSLVQLKLSETSVSGTIPIEWGNLKRLSTLYLYNCRLSGPFPEAVYEMESMANFWIDGNSFTGTIDSRIGNLEKLSQFIVRRNHLSGTIPDAFVRKPYNQSQLAFVFLHFNDFTGTITDEFCNLYPPPDTNQLNLLYSDCSPSNKTGPPQVTCNCCNRCCDTKLRGPCDRVEGN